MALPTQIRVQKGDTRSGIAKRLGVPVQSVGLGRSGDPHLIFPDEVLTITPNTPPAPAKNIPTEAELQDLANRDPERADTVMDELGFSGSPNTGNQTPAQVFKPFIPPIAENSELDDARELRLAQARKDANIVVDEDAIRAQTLASFQAEIDAINQLFAEKIRRERVRGANRLGQGGAIQARRGLLGSSFGQALDRRIGDENEEIVQGIEAEKSAKISAILNQVRSTASEEIKAKRKAKAEGLDSFIQYLGEATERKVANAKKIAQALTLRS